MKNWGIWANEGPDGHENETFSVCRSNLRVAENGWFIISDTVSAAVGDLSSIHTTLSEEKHECIATFIGKNALKNAEAVVKAMNEQSRS